jgi:hypothetical protein
MTAEDEFRTAEAVLEDISGHGACVQVEEKIPLGATIAISVGETRFYGYCSYCLYRDYGYFVGVRLSEATTWSSGVFEPRHLTDLRKLWQAEKGPPSEDQARSDSSMIGAPGESNPGLTTRA